MLKQNSRYQKSKSPKLFILILLAVMVVGVGAYLLFARNRSTDRPVVVDDDAQTDSTVPSAQEDFTEGGDREPGNSMNENDGSGGISDENGVVDPGTDTANPLTSTGGEITLFSPKKNSTVATGQIVTGTSTLPKVSYRLIDNVSGVISTGELNVVNGKFSGKFEFDTSATEGRLDIYAVRSDASEYANIEVPLRFK